MVARVTLHNLKQDRDEPIRAYGARLRGQASVCKYTQQCTGCDANVDYTDTILREVLCRGLDDPEIQMDLLENKNQDMTLEQVLRFVEDKETGKRSASRLSLPHATDAVTGSSYRRQKITAAKGPPPKALRQRLKRYAPTVDRRAMGKVHQPEYGEKIVQHLALYVATAAETTTSERCAEAEMTQKTARNGTEGEHENAISNTLCGVTSERSDKYATLDHHIYNQSTGKWSKRQSKSQPFITLSMCVPREDYECYGFKLSTPQSQILTYAMVDTGCQSCLAGLKVIQRLGLTAKDLISVRLKMH